MKRIAFLASYNGSSAKVIAKSCLDGEVNALPALLLSNNSTSKALEWAKDWDIPCYPIKGKDEEVRDILQQHAIDLVILSGYMKLISPIAIRAFPERIINIHPALLPQFGGQGMYGRNVHEAVKASGETRTGITVHCVDEIYDHGKIIAQKQIPLNGSESVDDIESLVRAAEPAFYLETIKTIL